MNPRATSAQLARGAALLRKQGKEVKDLRLCTNGDVLLLTKTPEDTDPPSNQTFNWVALAVEAEPPRRGRRKER